ncbi:hypothetical protein QTI66_11860 [Variovorax sp. J22R133]|uniref:hypothetical protein n=1 Tax=Variovorax brevis TaxID=3053503 RepID=UPI002575C1A1|nr:hypothetical protein [Variovorax sp. J22R133]MDM0112846.1 hypothetical protein [Variovorax sp. J22R133]
MERLTERGTVAAVLATLVRQRCAATGGSRTLRTGLQAMVPVSERPSVRRGLDALIEQGLLFASGEDIGFSPQGKVFMAHIQRLRGELQTPENARDAEAAKAMLASIEKDARFDPDRDIEDVRTLPGRLEGYRAARQPRFTKLLVLAGFILLVAVVYYFTRH